MPRTILLRDWLDQLFPRQHSERPLSIEPASADASFRRYFRVTLPDGDTRIVMDAPPSMKIVDRSSRSGRCSVPLASMRQQSSPKI